MATSSNYRLGSIWLVNFDPSIGTEILKTRPAMIISGTIFNQRRKVTVLPITSSYPDSRLLPIVVPIQPNDTNGLNTNSFIVCIDPMTFDKQRLARQLGILDVEILDKVRSILRSYLDLGPADRDLDESLE
jgi:mRNA interferase MazF